ncbi:trimethylamine methyltransferase family protein [Natranaerofaba carboxydovora]|uniref:trimethylamine methyltransferase family protein n=1 Tax=Natranaerofaba carboxydovora TaxID=2742683 RepID=UPI001F146005|nr:trimethylamine methyltransferase family protein [Natranaerofaba carboxydovora]UMZ73832.1 Trimethylamine methyltransferase (MTTB) [Natranaerofaba carboxydovora]
MYKADVLSKEDVKQIHSASMEILENTGIEFLYEPAIEVFKKAGYKVDGNRVYITEGQVLDNMKKAPSSFTIYALNPDKNVYLGGNNITFAPGYGAPFVLEGGINRKALLSDFENFAVLAATSPHMDFTGGELVAISDVPQKNRHREMIFRLMKNSDKPFIGSSKGKEGARDSINLAKIVFGEDYVKSHPVMVPLLNSFSPLAYSDSCLEAIMEYVKDNQPVIISSVTMAGTTGPATIAGSLAVQNAEVLAGLTFTQLLNPGNPIIYGGASAITDMQDGELSIGGPETVLFVTGSVQLAKMYDIPVRGGGGSLTDAKAPGYQSSWESSMNLMGSAATGVNFILHAAGGLQFYNAMSYEKFILDEELCGMAKHIKKGVKVTPENLALDLIKEVGPRGEFITSFHTFENYKKEFYFPTIADRYTYSKWIEKGKNEFTKAKEIVEERLYLGKEMGILDKETIKRLDEYVNNGE